MDDKNIFLNRFIQEKIYLEPLDFENHSFSNYIFKLHKVRYGLKQAPRAWYKRLNKFLLKNNVDITLFLKKRKEDLLIIQIYIDNIIFGATNKSLCKEFSKLMQEKFEMSMMKELNFFFGL